MQTSASVSRRAQFIFQIRNLPAVGCRLLQVCWLLPILFAWIGCENEPEFAEKGVQKPTVQQKQVREKNRQVSAAAVDDSVKADDWFEDVTQRSGLQFSYQNGRESERYWLVESFGGGAAVFDFDRDGDVDLFLTGGGKIAAAPSAEIRGLPHHLSRNDGIWQFVDVTVASGLDQAVDYSQGCTVADVDADGFPDLFVCCFGRCRLYRNRGDGTFQDATESSLLAAEGFCTAAAFGDLDRDGFPDLFVARYNNWNVADDIPCFSPRGVRDLCGPSTYPGTTCLFFHNSGDGKFEDWSERIGIKGEVRGLGVVAADLNGDGWLDFYVTSDEAPKQLYWGRLNLPLVEGAAEAGVAVNEWGRADGSMGIDVGDYDGNGLPDLFITNFENEDHSLFKNLGAGQFVHATAAAGLSGMSRIRSGFGTSFIDFDSDGWLDLFVFNGNPIYQIAQSPYKQRSQLFRNREGKRFVNESERGGAFFRHEYSGRGSAVGDFDNDGGLDLVVVPMNEPVRLLRNRQPPSNFLCVELLARQGESDAVGAKVESQFRGRTLTRFAVRGGGFYSQSDARIIFPLEADVENGDVVVEWPGRGRERFSRLALRRTQLLIEGRGAPESSAK